MHVTVSSYTNNICRYKGPGFQEMEACSLLVAKGPGFQEMEACSLLINLRKGMQSSSEQPLVGEEHCVTILITAAKETINTQDVDSFSGRRNKHILRDYPSTRKIAELCFETTAAHSTIHPKRSALSTFSIFEEQAQALLVVVLPLPLSFDPPLNILHFTVYTTFHREATLKTALELLDYSIWDYSVMIWSQVQTTRYSPSKSIIECVKFRKRAEL